MGKITTAALKMGRTRAVAAAVGKKKGNPNDKTPAAKQPPFIKPKKV